MPYRTYIWVFMLTRLNDGCRRILYHRTMGFHHHSQIRFRHVRDPIMECPIEIKLLSRSCQNYYPPSDPNTISIRFNKLWWVQPEQVPVLPVVVSANYNTAAVTHQILHDRYIHTSGHRQHSAAWWQSCLPYDIGIIIITSVLFILDSAPYVCCESSSRVTVVRIATNNDINININKDAMTDDCGIIISITHTLSMSLLSRWINQMNLLKTRIIAADIRCHTRCQISVFLSLSLSIYIYVYVCPSFLWKRFGNVMHAAENATVGFVRLSCDCRAIVLCVCLCVCFVSIILYCTVLYFARKHQCQRILWYSIHTPHQPTSQPANQPTLVGNRQLSKDSMFVCLSVRPFHRSFPLANHHVL